jgi:hypothetical protein
MVTKAVAVCALFGLSLGAPLLAAGPVNGEVSAVWWANDLETSGQTTNSSEDGSAPGLRAEMWMLERYGLRATRFGSDTNGSQGADYTSLDVMWRALSPTQNNFVAVGVGWQQLDLQGFAEQTSGMRVALEGRVGLMDMLYAYGHGSYLPSLDDTNAIDPTLGRFEDLDAYEYEMGVAWNATPFLNVHAGYRVNTVNFSQQAISTVSSIGGTEPVTVNPGNGLQDFAQASGPPPDCTDCVASAAPNAVSGAGNTETESSGFYVGVGYRF